MAIPEFQAFFRPVLAVLGDGQVWTRLDIQERVGDEMGLTDEERNERLPGGGWRLSSRVHWAVTYLAQAGAVKRVGRGQAQITEVGEQLLKDNPDRIDNAVLKQFESFRDFVSRTSKGKKAEKAPHNGHAHAVDDSRDPLEQVKDAVDEMNAALVSELLTRIKSESPKFLETLILKLLVAMNYGTGETSAHHLGGPGDEGFDGVIHLDALGLERVYLQAKRYTDNTVGRPAIQSFVGALNGAGATRGVFITTSRFSSDAITFAKQVPQSVRLVDGEELGRLLLHYRIGVQVTETIAVLALDEDFFIREATA